MACTMPGAPWLGVPLCFDHIHLKVNRQGCWKNNNIESMEVGKAESLGGGFNLHLALLKVNVTKSSQVLSLA